MDDQRSREIGVKLAKALRDHAIAQRDREGLDVVVVLRAAAEFLREHADAGKLVDDSRTDPDERQD